MTPLPGSRRAVVSSMLMRRIWPGSVGTTSSVGCAGTASGVVVGFIAISSGRGAAGGDGSGAAGTASSVACAGTASGVVVGFIAISSVGGAAAGDGAGAAAVDAVAGAAA